MLVLAFSWVRRPWCRIGLDLQAAEGQLPIPNSAALGTSNLQGNFQ
jgi:hypothetical protein